MGFMEADGYGDTNYYTIKKDSEEILYFQNSLYLQVHSLTEVSTKRVDTAAQKNGNSHLQSQEGIPDSQGSGGGKLDQSGGVYSSGTQEGCRQFQQFSSFWQKKECGVLLISGEVLTVVGLSPSGKVAPRLGRRNSLKRSSHHEQI